MAEWDPENKKQPCPESPGQGAKTKGSGLLYRGLSADQRALIGEGGAGIRGLGAGIQGSQGIHLGGRRTSGTGRGHGQPTIQRPPETTSS